MICILIRRLQSHRNNQFPKQVSWPQSTQTLGLHALISNPPLDKLMLTHQVLIRGNLKQNKCLLPVCIFQRQFAHISMIVKILWYCKQLCIFLYLDFAFRDLFLNPWGLTHGAHLKPARNMYEELIFDSLNMVS